MEHCDINQETWLVSVGQDRNNTPAFELASLNDLHQPFPSKVNCSDLRKRFELKSQINAESVFMKISGNYLFYFPNHRK
jgi:hypothetical protein